MAIRIRGVDKVLNNLARQMAKIKNKSLAGLIEAGFLIQREAQKLCPVDVGNLKAGAYTMWTVGLRSGMKSGQEFEPRLKPSDPSHSKVVERLRRERPRILMSEGAWLKTKSILAAGKMYVQVGFPAYYAIYVHEDATAAHTEGQQWKFLQSALETHQKRILDIIRKRARIR